MVRETDGMLTVWNSMWEWARKNGRDMPCPRCGRHTMTDHNALSCRADVEICPQCGVEEAVEDMMSGEHDADIRYWWLFRGANES